MSDNIQLDLFSEEEIKPEKELTDREKELEELYKKVKIW